MFLEFFLVLIAAPSWFVAIVAPTPAVILVAVAAFGCVIVWPLVGSGIAEQKLMEWGTPTPAGEGDHGDDERTTR